VAITGASGHLGQWAIAAVRAAGHEVLGISRRALTAPTISGLAFEAPPWLQADLADPGCGATLREALRDVDAVVHLAGHIPGDTAASARDDALATLHANALGTVHLLDALSGTPHLRGVVYASTFEVYGRPLESPIRESHPAQPLGYYGATKLAGEHYLRIFGADRGLPCASLRLPAVYGPGDRLRRAVGNFVRGAAEGRPPEIHGDGEDRRELVYVADAAEAIVRALAARADGPINLGSGRGFSVLQIAETVQRVAGLDSAPKRLPRQKPRLDYVLDVELARRVLGWQPRTSLEHGIAAQLAWVRGGA
jgi:UDP-glucose 4-epimerase